MMMESPTTSPLAALTPSPLHSLSARRRRRHVNATTMPDQEFAFWTDTTTILHPPTTLHSADELFSDGFLLPLHSLSLQEETESEPVAEPGPTHDPEPDTGSIPVPEEKGETHNPASIMSSISSSSNSILSTSKRWKEIIFKRGSSSSTDAGGEKKVDETKTTMKKKSKAKGENVVKRRERDGVIKSSSISNPNELNINLWPFSRSRSAGNNANRSKSVQVNRKVSSAPCSRSNSSGERRDRGVGPSGLGTMNRRVPAWPSSPGRTGVPVGRASPVWPGPRRRKDKGTGKVLNLNVPMCIGYRESLSCRNYENGVGDGEGSGKGGGGVNGHFLGLRGLFSKKSVVTV